MKNLGKIGLKKIAKIEKVFLSGSFVVEAAFVVPIVLGIIFSMLYVLYIFHDSAVLYGNMHTAVVKVAEGTKTYSGNSEWKEDMQKGLWIFKIKSGNISKDILYVKSDICADCSLDIPVIKYFMDGKQEVEFEDKYLVTSPCQALRLKKALKKEGGD